MSVKPGVATTRTIASGEAVGTTSSETQGAPTPLEYGRQIQANGLTARGDANT
jgi:hypothetical protein